MNEMWRWPSCWEEPMQTSLLEGIPSNKQVWKLAFREEPLLVVGLLPQGWRHSSDIETVQVSRLRGVPLNLETVKGLKAQRQRCHRYDTLRVSWRILQSCMAKNQIC
ncbi:uncharacterized protein PGTG_08700 [Puccinia graminis f. sp. tritici CRL 75-36-700-3]|uniref:Uncharacterized protein n=1 Tax=Puccinia graminis f. sp. tritici (strain CRL 75-36-700-3 / race SCCL) TaxID=418459 RepID=E3KGT9_PUCGT|nr:uncharacterized protein PGTG_08700 [Puccinia graminis f. sp. tritici CRL 75-36-700-3]EFP83514.1 hypothetical protein PGTG_08700 [Puccinia graminis f. sp. tritici CRL 75-36-700-3]